MKYFIIGDVHGCYKTLKALVDSLPINKVEDTIIFIGDLFDRGKESYEAWKYVCSLIEDYGDDRCIVIRGNHEDMLIRYFEQHDTDWKLNGYMQTIESFNKNNVPMMEIKEWVKNNTMLFYKTDLFSVCHAGRYEEHIEDESEDTLIWSRASVWHNCYSGGLTVVGHTPEKEPFYLPGDAKTCETLKYGYLYEPLKYGIIDIDTGCVFNNKLTAIGFHEDGKFELFYASPKTKA